MNKHIELVKWLADDKSVSLEELEANNKDADAATDAACGAADWAAYWATNWATNAAYWATNWAADADYADYADADYAAYWRNEAIEYVRKYEELTK